ncbi:MAG: DUF4394 domain-containing protein, partial [Chloroflexota bacterium]|nr:DUF4394 domain-containing protein [Chloroflexota bacterium]
MLAQPAAGMRAHGSRVAAIGLFLLLILVGGFVSIAGAAQAQHPAENGSRQGYSPSGSGFIMYAISGTNQLIKFSTNTPGTIDSSMPVTGLQGGETLLGIDFRLANGGLYGLGSTSRIYTIDLFTGAATAVGASGAFTLAGTSFGFDFIPTSDFIRITSDADQNLRVNPNTGTLAATDSFLSYAMTDTNAGQNPNVVGSAYTNHHTGATTTTLFDIDSNLDVLAMQNPGNAGVLTTIGPLGVDTNDQVGFDMIRPTSSVNFAFASLTDTQSRLYSINLDTGAATLIGTIGGGGIVRGIALAPENPPATPTPTTAPTTAP